MSVSSLMTSSQPNTHTEAKIVRRSANYHPSIWGDYFIHMLSHHQKNENNARNESRVEELKEEVKGFLNKAETQIQKLILVDSLQRLGISYHFEEVIEAMLQQLYDANADIDDDLHIVALQFRLLRQQGFNVSANIFSKFKDENGSFKKSIQSDARGMLSLYEASHLAIEGEDILDEACSFSSESMLIHLDHPLPKNVKRALELPLHKGMLRLEARHYISVYEEDKARNDVLLELAKLDFNLLQSLHQNEIRDISRWWKDLGLASKLPFARDRLVELYFWMLGVYFEPQFSLGRIQLTKVSQLISVIDDIYDLHGTLDELELFTDAFNRWDLAAMNQLPEYMKICYQAVYDTTNEIEYESMSKGKGNRISYFKKAFKDLCNVYLREAQWYHRGQVPTFDEYLSIASTSAAYVALITVVAINMGEILTEEALDLIVNECKSVNCSSLIARFCDDIATCKEEQERGDAPSSVQCYMLEHGVCEDEAREHIKKLTVKAWKELNQECLKKSCLPKRILSCIVNFARMGEVIYQYGDGYGTSTRETKDHIIKLFIENISI